MRGSRTDYVGGVFKAILKTCHEDYNYRTDHKRLVFIFDPALKRITTIRGEKRDVVYLSESLTDRLKEVCLEPMLLSKYKPAIDAMLNRKHKRVRSKRNDTPEVKWEESRTGRKK